MLITYYFVKKFRKIKGLGQIKVNNVNNIVENCEKEYKKRLSYAHFVYNMFITLIRTNILSTHVEL